MVLSQEVWEPPPIFLRNDLDFMHYGSLASSFCLVTIFSRNRSGQKEIFFGSGILSDVRMLD